VLGTQDDAEEDASKTAMPGVDADRTEAELAEFALAAQQRVAAEAAKTTCQI